MHVRRSRRLGRPRVRLGGRPHEARAGRPHRLLAGWLRGLLAGAVLASSIGSCELPQPRIPSLGDVPVGPGPAAAWPS